MGNKKATVNSSIGLMGHNSEVISRDLHLSDEHINSANQIISCLLNLSRVTNVLKTVSTKLYFENFICVKIMILLIEYDLLDRISLLMYISELRISIC